MRANGMMWVLAVAMVVGGGLWAAEDAIRFEKADGTELMRVQPSGNVLVGTATDTGEKLQVSGTSKLAGNTSINGDLIVDGVIQTASGTDILDALDEIRLNQILLAFQGIGATTTGALTLQNGWIDNFTDEAMIDGTTSTNESYNSSGDYYEPTTSGDTNLSSGATATASTDQGGARIPGAAIDGDNGTEWLPSSSSLPHWLQLDFGSGVTKTLVKYSIRLRSTASIIYSPTAWKFQGSNDGTSWTDLDTQTKTWAGTGGEEASFTISNTTAYRYYRLYVTNAAKDGSNNYWCAISELGTFEASPRDNMTLVSESVEAESNDPDNALVVVRFEAVDAVTVGTDLKCYISMDDGTNFEELTTREEIPTGESYKVFEFSKDGLTAKTDSTMVYKIETANNKNVRILNVAPRWEY